MKNEIHEIKHNENKLLHVDSFFFILLFYLLAVMIRERKARALGLLCLDIE